MPVQPPSSKNYVRKIKAGETYTVGPSNSPFSKKIETKDEDPTIRLNKKGATDELSKQLKGLSNYVKELRKENLQLVKEIAKQVGIRRI